MRRFFENEFSGGDKYSTILTSKDGKKKLKEIKIKDYRIQFSDVRLKKELDRFIHGTANRFIPITLEVDDPRFKNKNITHYMQFKGYNMTKEEFAKFPPGTADRKSTRLNSSHQIIS